MNNHKPRLNQPVGGARQDPASGEQWICLAGFTNGRHKRQSANKRRQNAIALSEIRFNLVSRLATVCKRLAILKN